MSYMVLKKKHIIMATAGILALILLIFFVLRRENSTVTEASAAKRQLPIYSVEKTEKVVSISFDAAWGNTKKVQNLAGSHNHWVSAPSHFPKNPDFNTILK